MLIDARYKVIPTLDELEAAAATADSPLEGATVDMRGNVGVAFHMAVTEATGLTSAIMTLETSDDDSTWVAATFDEVVGAADGDLSVTLAAVGTAFLSYAGTHRYVRSTIAIVATDVDINTIITKVAQFTDSAIAIPGN